MKLIRAFAKIPFPAVIAVMVVFTLVFAVCYRPGGSVDLAAERMRALVEATAVEFGLGDHVDEISVSISGAFCQPTNRVAASARLHLDLRAGEFDPAKMRHVAAYWEGYHGDALSEMHSDVFDTEILSVFGRL